MSAEPLGQRGRAVMIGIFMVVLLGLLFWYGTVTPDPSSNDYPEATDVWPDVNDHIGERIVLRGAVLDTDPVIIGVLYDGGSTTVVLENVNEALLNQEDPLTEGDAVSAFGVLRDESTLETERATTRDRWEYWYMYVISFVGGLWVLGRFLRGWRFDRDQLAFVSREHPLTVSTFIARLRALRGESDG